MPALFEATDMIDSRKHLTPATAAGRQAGPATAGSALLALVRQL